ncbi:MAG: hemolysin III [Rhodobacteraceae bacterium HLUCCA12]|nr:MAG: hemolysin III [Rhodobacteraceae bacterium HLUCCA12]
MTSIPDKRDRYTRAERLADAVVHVTGLSLVLMAVPVLIVVTALQRGDALSLTGVSVYGGALFAMIFCSALYNMSESFDWGSAREWLFKRLDHAAIYVKIAGTYTPFTLLSGQGFGLTAGLWGAAAAGVALKLVSPWRFRWLALALYLGMGWAGVVAGQALLAQLPVPVLVLMLVGGGIYTAGVVFYLWERLPFHNTIWHVLVLAASLIFYAAVLTHVVIGGAAING